MPDLNLGPAEERSYLPAILIAAAVLIVIAIAVFFLNPRKTADISVTKIDLYAPHTEFQATPSGPGASHVIGQGPSAEDDLYAVVTVSITDDLRLPLFIDGTSVTLTAADGSQTEAIGVPVTDDSRLEQTFPQLTPLLTNRFAYGQQISPKQTATGSVLVLFSNTTEASWKARKSATVTLNLRNQAPLTASLPQ
jgi:hypothetical protein